MGLERRFSVLSSRQPQQAAVVSLPSAEPGLGFEKATDAPAEQTPVAALPLSFPWPVEPIFSSAPIPAAQPEVAPLPTASKPVEVVRPADWPTFGWLDRLIDSAAGYDDRILAQYGTATDHKRRRNIGRAILVATAVGALGWFSKIAMSGDGLLFLFVALIVGGLYAVLSYSLESFFASNVDPFASATSKSVSLFGRALLSMLIALTGALPWIGLSLKSSVQVEMSRQALQEQSELRQKLSDTYGAGAVAARADALSAESQQWAQALLTMPGPIAQALEKSQACGVDFERMRDVAEKNFRSWNARLASIDKLQSASTSVSGTSQAVQSERAQIQKSMARSAQEMSTKRDECAQKRLAAESSRDAHIRFATEQRDASQSNLAGVRQEQSQVESKVRVEKQRIDTVVQGASKTNSSAEFSALWRVLASQTYAQALAALIFIGLFLVDVLPLTLRLFARPGPYDAEKRTDDSIKHMRAQGRMLEAQMIHDARCKEMQSADLQRIIQAECRPHIRSMAVNRVSGFLNRNVKA